MKSYINYRTETRKSILTEHLNYFNSLANISNVNDAAIIEWRLKTIV